MEDPIKVIHKYKNNNNRIQYNLYIMVGNIIPKNVMKILEFIKELNFYETLSSLTSEDNEILSNYYGEHWYEKFFITAHIDFMIKSILEDNKKMKELKDIYGKDWVQEHINSHSKRIQNVIYSYEDIFKEDRTRKAIKKFNKNVATDEEFIDYTTQKKHPTEMLIKIKTEEEQKSDESSSQTTGKSPTEPYSAKLEDYKIDNERELTPPFIDKNTNTYNNTIDGLPLNDNINDQETGKLFKQQSENGVNPDGTVMLNAFYDYSDEYESSSDYSSDSDTETETETDIDTTDTDSDSDSDDEFKQTGGDELINSNVYNVYPLSEDELTNKIIMGGDEETDELSF